MIDFSKWPNSWKILFEPTTGNVVIPEEEAYVYRDKQDS